jgi:cystathionine beta-lyase family protein involved in aluminum resistance
VRESLSQSGILRFAQSGRQENDNYRSDKIGRSESVIAFCEGIQASAPVDSHVKPVAVDNAAMKTGSFMAAAALAYCQGYLLP